MSRWDAGGRRAVHSSLLIAVLAAAGCSSTERSAATSSPPTTAVSLPPIVPTPISALPPAEVGQDGSFATALPVVSTDPAGGTFTGSARITNVTTQAVTLAVVTYTLVSKGVTVGTLSGTAQNVGPGEVHTVQLLSMEQAVEWDSLAFQVDSEIP